MAHGIALPQARAPAAYVPEEATATTQTEAGNDAVNEFIQAAKSGLADSPSATSAVDSFIQGVASDFADSQPTAPPVSPQPKPEAQPKPMCDYIFGSIHQYGGGSLYQSPIDNRILYFSIENADGKEIFDKDLNWDSEFAFSVGRAEYGGSHNMWARAAYDGTSDSWPACWISFDGGEYVEGTGGDDTDINTNIVTIVKTKCTVRYEC
jgi:hypothetical protein